MSTKFPIVAIIGRTNVGKSTLFNSIAGKNLAIVEDLPGVTRDRNYAMVTRFDKPFILVDTGGLAGEQNSQLFEQVQGQTRAALNEADLILCIFDGLHGKHPEDQEVTQLVKQSKKPVIWIANKCEKPATELQAAELYSLGVDELLCVSSAHNKGVREVISLIQEKISSTKLLEVEEDVIKVAIVGKPNAGKSTFINKILSQDRLVTSQIAGTTRDTITIDLVRDGQKYAIIDTAGLRKKKKVEDQSLEYAFNSRTVTALTEADVTVLLLDASDDKPSEQDTKIAGLVHERGKPIVIVVNKWDLVEKDHKTVKEFSERVYDELKFVRYAPILFVSALSGRRCPSVLEKVKEVYQKSKLSIKTSEVNQVLGRVFENRQSPSYRGQVLKLFYATQVNSVPPTFMLFVNNPKKVNFSYERYIKNSIRKHFDFEGTDIRLIFKKRGNEKGNDES